MGIDKGAEIREKSIAGKPLNRIPKLESISGAYCAKGASKCTDLEFEKICTCPVCPVFSEYKLRKNDPDLLEGFYCRDGMAD